MYWQTCGIQRVFTLFVPHRLFTLPRPLTPPRHYTYVHTIETNCIQHVVYNMYTPSTQHLHNMYTPSTQHLHKMYATFMLTAPRHSTHLHTIHTSCTQHLRNMYKHFYTCYTTQKIATFDTCTHHSQIMYASFPQHSQARLHALRNIYFTEPRHSTRLHTICMLCTQHFCNSYTFTRVTQPRQLPHSTHLHTIYTTHTQF